MRVFQEETHRQQLKRISEYVYNKIYNIDLIYNVHTVPKTALERAIMRPRKEDTTPLKYMKKIDHYNLISVYTLK
jgi:hypothetical protein